MSKDELFELYKRVQRKDREAEDLLIQEHKKRFPRNYYHTTEIINRSTTQDYRRALHTMYLHLSQ